MSANAEHGAGDQAPTVRDHPEKRRYEAEIDGHTAFLRYARRPGAIQLIHTEVPEALRGEGVANALAKAALDAARDDGIRVIPTCPFVKAYLRRHPGYQALVVEP